MATFNTVIKKRNATNTDWDNILPITTGDNVLLGADGNNLTQELVNIDNKITSKVNDEKTERIEADKQLKDEFEERVGLTEEQIKLVDELKYNKVFTLDKGNYSTQGMCVTPNYIVIAYVLSGRETENTILKVLDRNTYEVLNTINSYCFYHANSLCYVPENQTIVITHCINNGSPMNTMSVVDATKLLGGAGFVIKTVTLPWQTQAITWDGKNYYLDSTTYYGWTMVLDENFTEIRRWQRDDSVVVQSIDCYSDYLILSQFNIGIYSISPETVGTGMISIYTKSGEFVKRYTVPRNILGTEIESLMHMGDGIFLSTFNGVKCAGYLVEVFELTTYYSIQDVPYRYGKSAQPYTVYYDSSYTGSSKDGSESRPFAWWGELRDYMLMNPTLQTITVVVKGVVDETMYFNGIEGGRILIQGVNNPRIKGLQLTTTGELEVVGCTIYGKATLNSGIVLRNCTCLLTNCTVEYSDTTEVVGTYTPIYALQSKLSFDNGVTTVNGGTEYYMNLVFSQVMISNGLAGTSTAKIRNKGSIIQYSNTYFTSVFNGYEYLVGGLVRSTNDIDTGWVTATLKPEFEPYSAPSTVRYRKINNIATIKGIIKPTAEILASMDTVICTLPVSMRPLHTEISVICGGSGVSKWLLTIKLNGNVTCSRFSTDGATNDPIPVGTWLPFSTTYFVE